MKKECVLVWGNGNVLKQNIYWIKQIYHIAGITDSDRKTTEVSKKLYVKEEALRLEFDKILIASFYWREIIDYLVHIQKIKREKIKIFSDEFHQERREEFGDRNKNVTFYILRAHWDERKNGFFNFYERAAFAYHNAKRNGYELLVDMKNYYTEYAGLERYGKVNVWTDYFRQPSEYTLEEAYESQNVILSRFGDDFSNQAYLSNYAFGSVKYLVDTHQNLAKMHGCMQASQELKHRLEKEEKKLNGKVLGVLARGTDMVSEMPGNHHIPMNPYEFAERVKIHMKQFGYEFIYLATEDENIFKVFQEKFSDALLCTEQPRTVGRKGTVLMDIKFDRENDRYLRGMEYCLVILMLSKCQGLIANCFCGGVAGALLLKTDGGGYREVEVMDLGMYPES